MTPEQLLLAKLELENQQAGTAPVIGAIGGGIVGGLGGQGVHSVGNAINRGLDKVSPYHPVTMRNEKGKPIAHSMKPVPRGSGIRRLKPGNRMAGALVGVLLGGGAGEGVKRMMIENSPTSALLAKLQTDPASMTERDIALLEETLADTYRGIIGA